MVGTSPDRSRTIAKLSAARCAAILAASTAAALNSPIVTAAPPRPEQLWKKLSALPPEVLSAPPFIRPTSGQAVELDETPLRALLAAAPKEGAFPVRNSPTVIALPRPDGRFERFAFVESPVMQAELQAKSPSLHSYLGQGLDRPGSTVRFDTSPLGFRAQILQAAESGSGEPAAWYIDPVVGGDTRHYMSYFHGALEGTAAFACTTPGPVEMLDLSTLAPPGRSPAAGTDSGPVVVVRNEYGIAVSTTGEFSVGVGNKMKPPQAPTLDLIKGVIQTTIGRVNQILERDGPVRLLIVNNNDSIVYLDPNTDPYDPRVSDSDLQAQFQDNINHVLGTTNYSLGHTFHWQENGYRGDAGAIGVACNDSKKALGFSATSSEYGDYFAIDLVAHEIGHQLGATHTFNGWSGSCASVGGKPQWTASSAYETGSGSTIMSYGGTCGPDDIVSYPAPPPPPQTPPRPPGIKDPMYNLSSMIQIANFVTGTGCVAKIPTSNYHPGATPASQGPYYIPTDTPFRLNSPSAEYGGPSDVLTYSIEQFDLGPQMSLQPDTGQHEPLLRVLAPSAVSERKFPRFDYVLSGNSSLGENLPRFSRSSGFRGVLRDNVAGAGGWGWGDINVQFVLSAGFKVTAPTGGGAYCGGQAIGVTWNVANTNEAPINASTVDILMSTDNGQNFPWTLAADFPNSGAALLPLPSVPTADARILVQSSGGLFFNVNAGKFEVASGPPTIQTQPQPVSICELQNFTLSYTPGPGSPRHIQWYKDGVAIPGATGESYTNEFSDHGDSGDYKVVISNGCGTVTSNTVRVQVGVTFDQTLTDPNPQACQNVVLPSYARGVGTLSYQWVKDGDPLAGDTRITGVKGPTLTIGTVRYEDEGVYRCRVTDQCETRSTSSVRVALPTPQWSLRTTTGPIKRGIYSTDLAYDASRSVSVLYGGSHPDGQMLADTWEWDGLGWTQRLPAHTPGARREHEMTYDTRRQAVLLFGGTGFLQTHNRDVWSYDGVDWTLLTNSPDGPPNNYAAQGATAFDSARGKMVLIQEGSGGSGPTNNTWEFDSATATWSLASSGPGPSYAYSPIAFDASRSMMVGQYYWLTDAWADAKTWTSTGAGWVKTSSPTPPRYYPSMAYDHTRRRVTMYSCCRNSGPGDYHTDTYAFDGSVWTSVLPDITTSQLDSVIPAGLTFDSRRRAMVMIGSAYNDAYYANYQTWEYRYRDRVMFDRDPAGVGANAGTTVQFSAVADGVPGLTYRWRRGTTDLVDGPGPGGSTISGATTPTLTISSVNAANEGSYRLAATNLCGQQLSAAAPLAIAGSGSGRVPGDAGSTGSPLRVSKSGANVKLTWSSSCRPTDSDYEVYEGTLGSYYSHSPRLCSTAGATTATFTPNAGARYFLVVPTDGTNEGSYGIDSKGFERPQRSGACRPRLISTCP